MSMQTLFKSAEPLTKEQHGETYLETGQGYGFAKEMLFVPALVGEFADLASEYVIGFLERDDKVSVVALLGLGEGENLFVDGAGKWAAAYVPALLRQYPFAAMLDSKSGGKPGVLCIATNHEGLNTEGRGQALFSTSGELSEFTLRAQKLVAQIANDGLKSEAFCKRIKELGLLVPMQAELKGKNGETRRITGIQAVNRKALNELPAETLKSLHISGALELIYQHLASLRNLRNLVARVPMNPTTKTH